MAISDKCLETIHACGALAPVVTLIDSPLLPLLDASFTLLSKLLLFDRLFFY